MAILRTTVFVRWYEKKLYCNDSRSESEEVREVNVESFLKKICELG